MAQEGRLISFPPVGPAAHPSVLANAEAGAEVDAEASLEARFAFLSLSVRRVAVDPEGIPPEVAPRILNRCLLAALEALSAAGVVPVIAGTSDLPVIEARFDGPDAASASNLAATEACAAVRKAQRAHEREFQAHVGIAAGREVTGPEGTTRVVGRPDLVARRLRDEAPPGQVLTDSPTEPGEGLARP